MTDRAELFRGKLLVCDMDGTLLNGKNRVSRENLAALLHFTGSGGLFTVATGRTYNGLKHFPELPVNAPAIFMNGAQIYDTISGKTLTERHLAAGTNEVLTELAVHFPELGVEIFTKNGVFITNENNITNWHRHKEEMLPGVFRMSDVPEPWYKVVLAWENEKLARVGAYLDGRVGYKTVWCEEVFLDILEPSTSKGEALKELAGLLGIGREAIIAVGDNLNDLEMVRFAGTGFAVENAHEGLKKEADCSCCHHDKHAVAKVIDWIEERQLALLRGSGRE